MNVTLAHNVLRDHPNTFLRHSGVNFVNIVN